MHAINQRPSQGYAWLLSFLGATLLCLVAFISFGFYSLKSWIVKDRIPTKPAESKVIVVPSKSVEATVIVVSPKPASVAPPLVTVTPPAEAEKKPSFARTSDDQASAPPEKNEHIGERDTIATSDAPADATAPEQISQKGRPPLSKDEIETTISRLQDGSLDHDSAAAPMAPPSPTPPPVTPPVMPAPPEEKIDANAIKPKPLAKGDTIVERNNEQESPKPNSSDALKPKPPEPKQSPTAPPATLPKPTAPKPSANEPGFRGNQQKTLLNGSISRQGKSALNVSKTALGKYHAAVSRAIEAEWHRKCTTYRDLITPGTITVRFVIDSTGEVRSASVVDMVDAGQIQKGFTLDSIRQANLPNIPEDLQKKIVEEPLELIFNFYF
jgi:hypothetical protein